MQHAESSISQCIETTTNLPSISSNTFVDLTANISDMEEDWYAELFADSESLRIFLKVSFFFEIKQRLKCKTYTCSIDKEETSNDTKIFQL